MARKIINIKWPATCADCGAHLPAGARARCYGRGKIYGADCHNRDGSPNIDWEHDNPGLIASKLDPVGVYNGYGEKIGSTCHCEDYPCCGH